MQEKNPAAVAMGKKSIRSRTKEAHRAMSAKGGASRWAKMTPEERSEYAKMMRTKRTEKDRQKKKALTEQKQDV